MESLQFLVNGAMLGGIYAVIAVGFALVYGVMNVLNLAHGSMIMIGAYVAYWSSKLLGLEPLVTVPISGAALFVLGYVAHRSLISRVLERSIFMTFILTFGLDMVLINGAEVAWGGNSLFVESAFAGRSFSISGLFVPYTRLAVLAAVVAIIVGLLLFMSQTRLGLAVKATALHREAAQLAGVDIRWVFAITFGISAGLAGMAGALLAIIFPIDPFMGVPLIGKAFAVAVLGGLGSVTGSLVAGFVLAFAEILGVLTLGAGWSDAVAFLILLVAFVVRPQGLFGKEYYAEVKM